tara:strand:+ start:1030 stop:1452 length:423 start_codon:yes stop_codon:yes gene_type:complete
MEVWVKYALIAAAFLSIKNMISKHLSEKYQYIDYLIYAITLSFIGLWSYVFATGYKPKKVENTDILIIIFRIIMVFAVIDPSIYKAFKSCANPGKASCIINMEVILTFILSVIFLKSEIEAKSVIGMALVLGGGFLISYK